MCAQRRLGLIVVTAVLGALGALLGASAAQATPYDVTRSACRDGGGQVTSNLMTGTLVCRGGTFDGQPVPS